MKKPKRSKTDVTARGADGFKQFTATEFSFVGDVSIEAAAPDKTGPRRFNIEAYNGGKLRLKEFPLPVVLDLATLQMTERARPVLKAHNYNDPIGHTDQIVNDGRTLKATGVFSIK